MGYKVLHRFMDLEDSNFIYEAGWDYPRAGHFVSQKRLAELSSSDNRQGMPLIIESGEVKKAEPSVTEILEEEEVAEDRPKKKKKER